MSKSLIDDFSIYLHEMGLSEYEAKAYLGSLQSGVVTAKEASDAVDIPQSRVYDVFESLESKGFISVQPGRPKKFGPVEPEVAINQYIEYKRSNLHKKIEKTKSIGDEFIQELDNNDFNYRSGKSVDIIWSYRGRNYILNQFGDYCAASNKALEMVTTGGSLQRIVNSHKETLRDRHKHGVNIKIIIDSSPPSTVIMSEAQKWADIRKSKPIEGRIYVFDSERSLISWNSEAKDKFVAVTTKSEQLNSTFQHFFNILWTEASDI